MTRDGDKEKKKWNLIYLHLVGGWKAINYTGIFGYCPENGRKKERKKENVNQMQENLLNFLYPPVTLVERKPH